MENSQGQLGAGGDPYGAQQPLPQQPVPQQSLTQQPSPQQGYPQQMVGYGQAQQSVQQAGYGQGQQVGYGQQPVQQAPQQPEYYGQQVAQQAYLQQMGYGQQLTPQQAAYVQQYQQQQQYLQQQLQQLQQQSQQQQYSAQSVENQGRVAGQQVYQQGYVPRSAQPLQMNVIMPGEKKAFGRKKAEKMPKDSKAETTAGASQAPETLGAKGTPGTPGAQGAPGTAGAPGTQGAPGAPGAAGAQKAPEGAKAAKGTKKRLDPKLRKLLVIGGAIGGGLVVLGVAALVVWPILFQADYEETYEKATELSTVLSGLGDYNSCRGVVAYAHLPYTTDEAYGGYMGRCAETLIKIKEQTEVVGAATGQRDGELRGLWRTYLENFERLMPVYDRLMVVYPAWYQFESRFSALNSKENWQKTVSEEELAEVVQTLAESDVESYKKYAEGFLDKYGAYAMAYKKQSQVWDEYRMTGARSAERERLRIDHDVVREETERAWEAWRKWDSENGVDLTMETLLSVDLDRPANNLNNVFNNYYRRVNLKRLEVQKGSS